MNEVQQTLEVAKGISDYGIMIIICAVFLLLSSGLMVTCFQWFKKLIDQMLEESRQNVNKQWEKWNELFEETRKQNETLNDIAEGLRTETALRIRNLTGFAFDYAVEQVCHLIRKTRKENHIADHEATHAKIIKSLTVMHEDRKSRFDAFTYRGKKLSEYCKAEWIEDVAKVVEGELYNENGENDGRAYTNVKLAYDDIKTDFYHNMQA